MESGTSREYDPQGMTAYTERPHRGTGNSPDGSLENLGLAMERVPSQTLILPSLAHAGREHTCNR